MKGLRFLLAAVVMMAAAAGARGQGFEWVKAYSGTDRFENMNQIKGSFVDAQGNIYIVGNMSAWGEILGVELLPREINRSAYNRQCVVIAKISPDGQLVWHKPIYSSGYDSYAHALSRMGDTAFMVMCRVSMKHYYDSYPPSSLYFLDTMLTSADEGYLTLKDSTWCALPATFFITFDLDGNVIERHSLEVGYIDSSGTVITYGVAANDPSYRYANALYTNGLSNETFTIDHDGNIYVIRKTYDFLPIMGGHIVSTQDGTIGALKIAVDGRRSFVHNLEPSPTWDQQILKFAPHFDSLMGGVYMFGSTYRDSIAGTDPGCFAMNVDRNNNIYASIGNVSGMPSWQTYINNSDSLFIRSRDLGIFSCIVVYNQELRAINIIQPTADDNEPNTQVVMGTVTDNGFYFDDESNSIFVQGAIGWSRGHPNIVYKRDTIRVERNYTAFWLRLDMDSLNLLSYGLARPPCYGPYVEMAYVAAKNNRVFSQIRYQGLAFADTTLSTTYGYDIAFAVWDYDGHELMVKNYNVSHPKNLTKQIHILDSAVYLTGVLHEDATFDTITLRGTGHSQAYVARYVDTAFMHPYVHREGREEQSITWTQELNCGIAQRRVALTATSTSGLPVSYSCSNSGVAQVRGDTLVLLATGTATVTARQEGDARDAAAEPVSKTLRGSAEGIGEASAEGLTLYPNPTTGVVHVDCDGCTVKEAMVVTPQGRSERVTCRDGRIDLSHLAAGVYYLEVRTETGVRREKITKF